MLFQFLFIGSLLGVCAAQDTVVTLLLPFDGDLAGSVIASNGDVTTYSITCPPSATSTTAAAAATCTDDCDDSDYGYDDCGIPGGATVTAGPSTIEYIISDIAGSYTYSLACQLQGTTSAHCTNTVEDVYEDGSTASTAVTTDLTGSDLSGAFMPVTIAAVSATTTPAPATTSAERTGSATRTTQSSSIVSTAAATTSNPAPQLTGSPQRVIGGLAAAAVVAAL